MRLITRKDRKIRQMNQKADNMTAVFTKYAFILLVCLLLVDVLLVIL